jgi:hypothetical protein
VCEAIRRMAADAESAFDANALRSPHPRDEREELDRGGLLDPERRSRIAADSRPDLDFAVPLVQG